MKILNIYIYFFFVGNSNERIRLPKTNPPPFTYLPSSDSFRLPFPTSAMPKSHSSLDLQCLNTKHQPMVREKDSLFSKTRNEIQNKCVSNRTTLYEEPFQQSFSNNTVRREFFKEKILPQISIAKTINTLADYNESKSKNLLFLNNSLSSNLPPQELKPKSNLSFYNISNLASSSSSSSSSLLSSSQFSSFQSSSTFVKEGLSFKLIDSSLIETNYTSALPSPKLRKAKDFIDDKSVHLQKIEDAYNKLSACLPKRSTRDDIKSLSKNFYFDDILSHLESDKFRNIQTRESSVSNLNLLRNFDNGSKFNDFQPPKPPKRSSSYIEKYSSSQNLNDYDNKINFDDINLSSLKKKIEVDETRQFSASIDVLNKTAQTIDSLVHQLQEFP